MSTRFPGPPSGYPGPLWATRYQRRQYQRWYNKHYGPRSGCLTLFCFVMLCGWGVSIALHDFHWSVVNVLIAIGTFFLMQWAARPRHRYDAPPPP